MSDIERTVLRHEITEDWFVDQLASEAECDVAADILTEHSTRIEVDLDYYVKLLSARVEDSYFNDDWCVRARGALGFKRRALKAVEKQRKQIADAERQTFFEFIRQEVGNDVMDEWRRTFSKERNLAERSTRSTAS